METETLGRLIKRLRKKHDDMTQGQLSAYAKVPREWLSLVETDKIDKPDRDRLVRIANALRVPGATILSAAGYDVDPQPIPERTAEELARELQGAIRREADATIGRTMEIVAEVLRKHGITDEQLIDAIRRDVEQKHGEAAAS